MIEPKLTGADKQTSQNSSHGVHEKCYFTRFRGLGIPDMKNKYVKHIFTHYQIGAHAITTYLFVLFNFSAFAEVTLIVYVFVCLSAEYTTSKFFFKSIGNYL